MGIRTQPGLWIGMQVGLQIGLQVELGLVITSYSIHYTKLYESASLRDLYRLYKALRKARSQRGAIDFESTEVQFLFDERGAVDDIRLV